MYSIPSLRALLSKTGPGPVAGNYPFYANGAVNSQEISGNNIYIAGNFTSVGKYSDLKSYSFAILNSTDASANYTSINKTLFNGTVNCSVISGNYIYVGGGFTVYNNQACQNLAKISLIDGSLDTAFNTISGFNGSILTLILDGSGNIYAGGAFTTYKGTTRQYVAKLNATTAALDTTFDTTSGFSSTVQSIALDSSGNLYVGGNFTTYKGIARERIAKLNAATAALDTTFDAASGFNNGVNSITLDSSGNLYAGGIFTTYKATARNGIAKLNSTTAALDTTFDTATGFGTSTSVSSILLDGSGNLYAGGSFTTYKSIARQRIAKLNATTAALDTTFDSASGFNSTVQSITLDGSGNLYAGGAFTTYKGTTRQYVAKLNATTAALDTTFDTTSGFSSTVQSIALDSSGNLYVGGNSGIVYKNINNAVTRNRIAKISLLTGNIDTTFDPGTGFNSTVNVIKLDSSGAVYAGGAFTTYQGTTRQYIVKINGIDATIETGLNSTNGFNAAVNDIVLDGLGSLYAAGAFTMYKGATRQYIAKLDASSGSNDNTFDSASGFNGAVNSIILDGSGNIYAGGTFTGYKGTTRNYIAKLNATTAALDTTFDSASGFNAAVNKLRLDSSGNLYVGGAFTSYKNYLCNYFCRLNPTNATYLDLFYSNAAITGLEINDGYAYLGGAFTSLASNTRSYGSFIDNSLNISAIKTNFTGLVRCSYVEGNYIYVGGSFIAYNGQSVFRIAKISLIDGSLDTTFNPSTSFNSDVNSITGDGSGNIYVGGAFTTYQGTTRQYIAKLNASTAALDTTFDTTSGFNNTVYSIELDGSGNLYAGGQFTTYKSVNSGTLIKINTTTAAYVNSIKLNSSASIFSTKIKDGSLYFGGSFTSISLPDQYPTLNSAFINSSGLPLNIGTSFNGQVVTSVISGNFVYVGGSFTSYKGQACQRIAKISLIDGSLDTTFDTSTGFNSTVLSIALDGSGNLYVGGNFTTYKGTTRQYIAKLNATTAALDTTFDTESGFNSTVNSIVLDPSGNIYVGGNFTTYKTVNSGSLIKINATTAAYVNSIKLSSSGYIKSLKIKDSSLYFGGEFTSISLPDQYPSLNSAFINSSGLPLNIGSSFNVRPYAAVISGNYVYVGGAFSSYKGQACQRIAKISLIDGSLDTTFDTSTGFNSTVYSIALDGSGNLYAGGAFTTYKGTTRQYIAKLNGTTAALDTTFDSASGFNITSGNGVLGIVLDSSGNVYCCGDFTTYKGTTRQYIAKLNGTTAALDTTFDSASGFSGNIGGVTILQSIAIDSSGNIYAGGDFTAYKGTTRQYIAKLNGTTAALDTTFDSASGFNNSLTYIAIDSSNGLYAGGNFSTYKGTTRQYIAKLNATTAALDTTFDTVSGFGSSVEYIKLDGSGSLYVGGRFTLYKGTSRRGLAKINATTAALDTSFNALISGSSVSVSAIDTFSGGIFIGGFFDFVSPPCVRLGKVDLDFNYDSNFDTLTSFNGQVQSIALDGSGNIYAGGGFTTYKGTTRQYIAKLNSTTAALDTAFDSASGFNSNVLSITLDDSGNLYVGGNFTTYKGTARTALAKINATTAALDTSFIITLTGSLSVQTINIFSGGIFFGGSFDYLLFSCQRLAKTDLNFVNDSNFNTATAFDSNVNIISSDSSGNIYVGGAFSTYKGVTRQRIAKLNATNAALDTTFDPASGFNSSVISIALDTSGNLYVGGQFTTYKGTARQYVAKLDATTAALDSAYNLRSSSTIYLINSINSNNIFLGSSGIIYDGIVDTRSVGKFSISSLSFNSSFVIPTFSITSIGSFAFNSTGGIFVGGSFSNAINKVGANNSVIVDKNNGSALGYT